MVHNAYSHPLRGFRLHHSCNLDGADIENWLAAEVEGDPEPTMDIGRSLLEREVSDSTWSDKSAFT